MILSAFSCPNLLWSPRNQPQIWEPKLHRFSAFQGAVSLILNDLRKNGNRWRFPAIGGLPSRLLITDYFVNFVCCRENPGPPTINHASSTNPFLPSRARSK
jgi:hypothetical protein